MQHRDKIVLEKIISETSIALGIAFDEFRSEYAGIP